VLPCAPGTRVEYGTGYFVWQWTHRPHDLTVRVGLLLALPGVALMCSLYRSRTWYMACRSSVDTLSTCSTSKRRSAVCNDRGVLPFAPITGEEHGTGHLVRQCTQCPFALPVCVGQLLAMTGTSCHVLPVPE
jgi:hypothetical protein